MQRLDDIKKRRVIDHAVELGMEGRKKSGVRKMHLLSAVAVVFIGFIVYGFTFSAWAQRIPDADGIFELHALLEYEQRGVVWPLLGHLQEFVSEVDLSGELGRSVITIEEVVFDGTRLFFGYTIEGNINSSRSDRIDIENLGFIVDGEEVQCLDQSDAGGWGARPSIFHRISNNEYIGVFTIYFDTHFGLVDNGIVHFDVIFDNDSWHVSFPIERIVLEEIVINETFSYDGFEMTVTYLLDTPSGMMMYYEGIFPIGYGHDLWIENGEVRTSQNAEMTFRVHDNLGNEWYNFQINGGGFQESDLGTTIITGVNGWIGIAADAPWADEKMIDPQNADYLIITPYVRILGSNERTIREIILGEIRINLPLSN